MNRLLIKLLISLGCCALASLGYAGEPPFSVTKPAVVQNMVAGSSQDLDLVLLTKVKSPNAVNIHCEFSSSSPELSASFNNNGCTSAGGIGINSSLPAQVKLTLTTTANSKGKLVGTVTFSQTNGRSSPVKVSLPIVIRSPTRIITFRNFCKEPVWFGLSSSAIPAKNNGSISCTTDSDCSSYTYSLCVNGSCGGGVCTSDSDCVNSKSGTCVLPKGATTATCTYCDTNSDCLTGSVCYQHQCFWKLPEPKDAATKKYELAKPTGGVIDFDKVAIPDYSRQNGFALQWGGGFAGRTGCTWNAGAEKWECKSGTCNKSGKGDGKGGCQLGEGFDAPVTQAEATLVTYTPDTYDVTIINGISNSIRMTPNPGNAGTPQAYNNPFICGSAGNTKDSVTKAGTLGGCSWNFVPPNAGFRWVDEDSVVQCPAHNCPSGMACGLTRTAIANNSATTTCGTPLGYWNENEICAKNASYNQPGIINCTVANVGNSGNSIINLLACTGSAGTSCYNVSSSSTTCCGCTNWQDHDVLMPSNKSVVEQCQYPNGYWTGSAPGNYPVVLNGLIWLKQGCPSAYVYPFDDKASTFTCPGNNSQSGVSYLVDFCPEA